MPFPTAKLPRLSARGRCSQAHRASGRGKPETRKCSRQRQGSWSGTDKAWRHAKGGIPSTPPAEFRGSTQTNLVPSPSARLEVVPKGAWDKGECFGPSLDGKGGAQFQGCWGRSPHPAEHISNIDQPAATAPRTRATVLAPAIRVLGKCAIRQAGTLLMCCMLVRVQPFQPVPSVVSSIAQNTGLLSRQIRVRIPGGVPVLAATLSSRCLGHQHSAVRVL